MPPYAATNPMTGGVVQSSCRVRPPDASGVAVAKVRVSGRLRSIQDRFEMFGERLGRPGAVVALAVDEERRGAVRTAADRAPEVGVDAFARLPGGERPSRPRPGPLRPVRRSAARAWSERFSWCSKSRSCISQNFPCIPTASAISAAASACGCTLASGMLRKTKRSDPPNLALQPLHDAIGLAAVRALEVAVFDEGQRGVRRAAGVVVGA